MFAFLWPVAFFFEFIFIKERQERKKHSTIPTFRLFISFDAHCWPFWCSLNVVSLYLNGDEGREERNRISIRPSIQTSFKWRFILAHFEPHSKKTTSKDKSTIHGTFFLWMLKLNLLVLLLGRLFWAQLWWTNLLACRPCCTPYSARFWLWTKDEWKTAAMGWLGLVIRMQPKNKFSSVWCFSRDNYSSMKSAGKRFPKIENFLYLKN